LIYAIIRAHGKFENLRDFTLASAVQEISRIQLAKEEKKRLLQQPITQQPPSNASESEDKAPGENTTMTQEQPDQSSDQLLSEKARGKLKEQDPASEGASVEEREVPSEVKAADTTEAPETAESLRRQSSASSVLSQTLAPPGNPSRFTPTQAWIDSWKPTLPIGPVLMMLDHLVPQVKDLCSTQSLTSDAQVLEFLRKVTLVGILPHPQPIHIRRFQWGEALVIWFRSMLWGQAYVFSLSSAGVWNGTNIKLFQIKHETSQSKADASGNRNEPAPAPTQPLEQSQTNPTRPVTTEATDQ
jgi:hypothetical protein